MAGSVELRRWLAVPARCLSRLTVDDCACSSCSCGGDHCAPGQRPRDQRLGQPPSLNAGCCERANAPCHRLTAGDEGCAGPAGPVPPISTTISTTFASRVASRVALTHLEVEHER